MLCLSTLQVLAGAFHDIIYINVDKDFPQAAPVFAISCLAAAIFVSQKLSGKMQSLIVTEEEVLFSVIPLCQLSAASARPTYHACCVIVPPGAPRLHALHCFFLLWASVLC